MLFLTIGDGENVREQLSGLQGVLSEMGLGELIKLKDRIYFTMMRYENPTVGNFLFDRVKTDSPDYQTVKPVLEQTLNKIYEEIDRRDILH